MGRPKRVRSPRNQLIQPIFSVSRTHPTNIFKTTNIFSFKKKGMRQWSVDIHRISHPYYSISEKKSEKETILKKVEKKF